MSEKRPMIITFIGDVSLLSAVLLIVSLFTNFSERFEFYTPIDTFSDYTVKILVSMILIIISYGFFKIKIWAYWLTITYNISFLVIYIIFSLKQNSELYYGPTFILLVLMLIITLPTKKYFIMKD